MKEKVQAIRDEMVTQAGGLVVGAAIGSVAGPEGAALGAAAGSVGALLAAKLAPDFFHNNIIHRYLNNRTVTKLLREQINFDFANSFLESQGTFDQAVRSASQMLKEANATDSSIDSIEARLMRGFHWSLAATDGGTEDFSQRVGRLGDYCRTNGPIRIATSAICPAVVAMFGGLHSRLSEMFGLQFEISVDEINGRDLFQSLRRSCDFHFAVSALEALVLTDPERTLPLRILGPLYGLRQRIFVSARKRTMFKSGIWVFSRSSAEIQYQVGLGVPRSSQGQEFADARQLPDLVENIPPADMVIAWDPIAALIRKRRDFLVVPNSDYTVHMMLFGHRQHAAVRRFPLTDFLGVFLAEWRRLVRDHDHLAAGLLKDHRYMRAFASGAGHEWTHEV